MQLFSTSSKLVFDILSFLFYFILYILCFTDYLNNSSLYNFIVHYSLFTLLLLSLLIESIVLGPYEREKNRMGKDKTPCQRQKFYVNAN